MGRRKSSSNVKAADGSELKEWEYEDFEMPQSGFEQKRLAARQKQAKLDALKAKRKDGNDGFDDRLEIYLPKSSCDTLEELDEFGKIEENQQFFRDPVTKQWIGVKQITKPRQPNGQAQAS